MLYLKMQPAYYISDRKYTDLNNRIMDYKVAPKN